MEEYKGNILSSPSQSSRYTVLRQNGEWCIKVQYTNEDGYKNLFTFEHETLVEMVNRVKINIAGQAGGAFRIDEFRNVVIPTSAQGSTLYNGGKYHNELLFEHMEKPIGASELERVDGSICVPGEEWSGPKVGMQYVSTAAGNDVRYTKRTFEGMNSDIFLSNEIQPHLAERTSGMISRIKTGGGRFYVNECGHVFTPVQEHHAFGTSWVYIYAGKIDLDFWFPDPHSN